VGTAPQLLHEAHGVGDAPVLSDLSVLDADDVDALELDRLVGWGDPHELAFVRASHRVDRATTRRPAGYRRRAVSTDATWSSPD
jgi:hypothetical protein